MKKSLNKEGDSNLNGEKMPVAKRRSISTDQFVEDSINHLRAGAILKGITYDFTTLINAFAEYGIRKLQEGVDDPLFGQVFAKYLDYDELKEWGLVDEWKDFQEFKEWKKKRVRQVIQQ